MPSRESVKKVPLGKNGPLIPQLGFGLMGMSHSYGPTPSDEERFALLDHALEIGATHWDSADLYGDNEELLGKWFKRTGKRNEIFLASKFGYKPKPGGFDLDSSYAYCKESCAKSLVKLGVDCIDLYYVHNVNPETPIEETMRALKELQDEGKIKYIGLSTVSARTLQRAVKIAPVACVQAEYSLFDRDIESPTGRHSGDLLRVARSLGVALVILTPLSRGIITSAFGEGTANLDTTDTRARAMPRWQEGVREQNVAAVKKVQEFADRKGCTVAQLALAWLLKQGDDILPIPGTKRVKWLDENWAAQDVELTDEEEKEVRALAEQVPIAGGTVPEMFEGILKGDTKEEEST